MRTGPLAVAPGTETLTIDDEVLVFDGEMIHLMSGSGAQIWQAVDGRRTADQIVADLARRHAPSAEVAPDVRAFLDDLVARGLVTSAARLRADGYEVPPHVAWTTDGAAVTLLDLKSGERQTLSGTGSRAWLHLADGLTLDAMVAQLAQEFPDAPPSFAEETELLVNALCDQSLLTSTS